MRCEPSPSAVPVCSHRWRSWNGAWLFALPAALVALTLVAPRRLRTLAAILAVIGVTAIVSGRLLAVHDEFASARIDDSCQAPWLRRSQRP